MDKKIFRKQTYILPTIEVINIQEGWLMAAISGDHRQAESGGVVGDAKKIWFDELDEENSPDFSEEDDINF